MKKYLSLVLALMMVLGMTAVAGAEAAQPQKIVWLSQGVGDNAWEGQTKPILEKYKELTGIEVVGEFYSFDDLFDIIEVKIASGSADYDVISVDVPMVAAYATRGYIAPMDQYFTAEEKAQFIDSAVTAGSWQGTFYAPPMNTSTQCLWYNKALLAEAGVTMPDSSVESRLTWDQVVEMATQVLDKVNPDCHLEVDGGVDLVTAEICKENGADVLVAGSAYFKTADKADFVKKIEA